MENHNAEVKKEEREQVVELGSDITKGKDGNIFTLRGAGIGAKYLYLNNYRTGRRASGTSGDS